MLFGLYAKARTGLGDTQPGAGSMQELATGAGAPVEQASDRLGGTGKGFVEKKDSPLGGAEPLLKQPERMRQGLPLFKALDNQLFRLWLWCHRRPSPRSRRPEAKGLLALHAG